ncbi:MAG: 3-hydroxyacyl-CoA dehydrogenase NAD-binding domain-containing protein, partial [Pygmaiobacter sp.]
MEIKKVAVIGCGTMGNQIAMQTALYGYSVWNYDLKAEMVQRAKDFSNDWFAGRIAKGKLTQEQAAQAQDRLVFTTDLAQAATDADLVLEAVPDVVEIKKAVLAQVDAYTPEHVLYGSNSSYLVSSLFADAVRHPENVANVHFFNPALVMQMVEVVQGPKVAPDTIETLMQ